MICAGCEAWIEPIPLRDAHALRCPECGHVAPHAFLPLFIVTGPSGAGKTAVVTLLQRLLPGWEIFDTDILWDSGGDWNMVKHNWLRIGHSIVQRRRPVILCGTIQPAELAPCPAARLFSEIHWLALDCADERRAARLRARPAWRGCTEELIARHADYSRWLRENAATAFDPPLTMLDTTDVAPKETALRISQWATTRWLTALAAVPAATD